MDRSYLNSMTLDEAATALAERQVASREVGGIIKQASVVKSAEGWLDELKKQLSGVWNAKPNLEGALAGNNMNQYWNDSAKEALRNALIGGGIGGGAGALKSLIQGDGDIMGNMLTGGLTGATLGGAGTGLYRGGRALMSESPTEHQNRKREEADQRQLDTDAAQLSGKKPNAPTPNLSEGAVGAFEQLAGGRPGDAGRIAKNTLVQPGTLGGGAIGGATGWGLGRLYRGLGYQHVLPGAQANPSYLKSLDLNLKEFPKHRLGKTQAPTLRSKIPGIRPESYLGRQGTISATARKNIINAMPGRFRHASKVLGPLGLGLGMMWGSEGNDNIKNMYEQAKKYVTQPRSVHPSQTDSIALPGLN